METFNFGSASGAPKLLGIEAHGVKPLRILAFAGSDGVGKDVGAVQALDHADMAARVARQARMRRSGECSSCARGRRF